MILVIDKILLRTLLLAAFLFYLHTPSAFCAIDSSAIETPPQLLTQVEVPFPPELIAEGVQGTVIIDLYIDEQGIVDSVSMVNKVHPFLDSLTTAAFYQARFSPSISAGKAVQSLLRFEYNFDIGRALGAKGTKTFTGKIIDRATGNPIPFAAIALRLLPEKMDSSGESSLSRYLEFLGTRTGMGWRDRSLVSESDSFGVYRFRSLPICSLRVRVAAPGFASVINDISVDQLENGTAQFELEVLKIPAYEISVYGQLPKKEQIKLSTEEDRIGHVDDIGKILRMKPGVEQVPEANSSILVKGQGIYDNRYMLFGIPIFAPSHFVNSGSADRSGMTMMRMHEVTFLNQNLGGKYSDATGGVILFEPDFPIPSRPTLKPRPEIQAGVSSQDEQVSVFVPRGGSRIQLSFNRGDDYLLKWANSSQSSESSSMAKLGYGSPTAYSDLMFLSEQKAGKAVARQLLWIAFDEYRKYGSYYPLNNERIPWGVAGFSLADTGSTPKWKVQGGGSRQTYFEGKRVGYAWPQKEVTRKNYAINAATNRLSMRSLKMATDLRAEWLDWNGTLVTTWSPGHGRDTVVRAGGEQLNTAAHLSVQPKIAGSWEWEANALLGMILPRQRAYLDPGLNIRKSLPGYSAGIYAGIQSSFPDIRGMPDSMFQGSKSSTYELTADYSWHRFPSLEIGVEAYSKFKTQCPALSDDPAHPIWDPSKASSVWARGISISGNLQREHLSLSIVQNFAHVARQEERGTENTYEWDVPWSNKAAIGYLFFEGKMQVFLTGIYSSGLPYRNILLKGDSLVFAERWDRAPDYKRLDFEFAYSQDVKKHRYLTRFDAYLTFPNLVDWYAMLTRNFDYAVGNVREYYWDANLIKHPILLESSAFVYVGVRIGARL